MKRFQHALAPVIDITGLGDVLSNSDYVVTDGELIFVRSTRQVFAYRNPPLLVADGVNVVSSNFGAGTWELVATVGAGETSFAGYFNTASTGAAGSGRLLDVTTAYLGLLTDQSKVWVKSVRDSYTWYATSTEVHDGVLVVNPTSNGANPGRFIRDNIASPTWAKQATWYIDPSGGNDENTGLTSGAATKTIAEMERRVGYRTRLDVQVTVWIMSTVPITDPCVCPFSFGPNGFIRYCGVPTVQYTSAGGFTAKTDQNRDAQTPGDVTDAAMGALTWTTVISGNWRIRTTGGSHPGACAFPVKDLGGNQARVSQWFVPTITYPTAMSYAETTVAANDPFALESLPSLLLSCDIGHCGEKTANSGAWVQFVDLQMGGGSGPNNVRSQKNTTVLFQQCAFINSVTFDTGVANLLGCKVRGTTTEFAQSIGLMYECAIMGTVLAQPGSAIWMDYDTIAQGTYLVRTAAGGTVRIGAAAAFDSATDGIYGDDGTIIINTTASGVIALWGNSNGAYGIRANGGRVLYKTNKPTITGVTNDAIVGGIAKAYAAIPYIDDSAGNKTGACIAALP